ncbi:MAG: hypothetical protein ACI376_06540 [Candidatus Bruticola sp.]
MKRIEKLLEEADLTYDIDDDNDYNIVMDLSDEDNEEDKGRSQLVIVSCEKHEISANGPNMLHVYSKAADLDDLSKSDFQELLEESCSHNVGGWELAGGSLIFTAKVPDSIGADDFRSIIEYVAQVADEKEAEYSDEDIN